MVPGCAADYGAQMADRGRRLRVAARSFAANARDPSLRRIQLGFAGACTAEWAFTVVLSVYAYRQGGATAVGVVSLLRMLPSAVLAPLASAVADRWRRDLVLTLVSSARSLTAVAMAAARRDRRAARRGLHGGDASPRPRPCSTGR